VFLTPGVFVVKWGVENNGSPSWLRGICITIGSALLLIGVALPFVLYPVFLGAREASGRTACLSNVNQIAKALQMYAADNDDRLPLARNWADAIHEYHGSTWTCKESNADYAYSLNRSLAAKPYSSFNPEKDVVLLFEAEGWRNSVGGIDDVSYRHDEVAAFSFVSGTAKAIRKEHANHLAWTSESIFR